MPEKMISEFSELVLYSIAAVSGALGGCAAASNHIMQGNALRISFVLAYAITGASMGVLTIAYANIFFGTTDLSQVIGHSLLAGLAGSTLMAGGHVSARWVLKRFGIEVSITARKTSEDRRKKSKK